MTAASIRPAQPTDAPAIDALLAAAFPNRAEADLVTALRAAGDIALELVAIRGEALVGHAAFCRLVSDAGASAAALAPLSVDGEARREGIGGTLVREGLVRLAAAGVDWVLALGDPAYYGRFGFSAGRAAGFHTPYDGPHQLAAATSPDAQAASGALAYPAAFAALG